MQPKPPLRYRVILLLLSGFILASTAQAQSKSYINWETDTMQRDMVKASHQRFKNHINAGGHNATSNIAIEVSKLKEIVDALSARGIADINFMIVSIRKEDTANYMRRNPGLTVLERNGLIGRQQLVIRVPKSIFAMQSGSMINGRSASFMATMLSVGLMPMDKRSPMEAGDYYFGVGTICPPPLSCTD
jgi:hypothetical protein